jgi:hypothetical protein
VESQSYLYWFGSICAGVVSTVGEFGMHVQFIISKIVNNLSALIINVVFELDQNRVNNNAVQSIKYLAQ